MILAHPNNTNPKVFWMSNGKLNHLFMLAWECRKWAASRFVFTDQNPQFGRMSWRQKLCSVTKLLTSLWLYFKSPGWLLIRRSEANQTKSRNTTPTSSHHSWLTVINWLLWRLKLWFSASVLSNHQTTCLWGIFQQCAVCFRRINVRKVI